MRTWPRVLIVLCALATVPLFVRAAEQARNPFQGRKLYVDPNSPARKQASEWQRSRPQDAARMRRIAEQPQVIWLGDWNRDIRRESDAFVTRIAASGALPVFVGYNIPNRDCGSHSAGGARDRDAYRRWIVDLTRGLERRPSVIILEPDALAGNDCLPLRLKDERYVMIRDAVRDLTKAGASVYIDAGHPIWRTPAEIADRLKKAGVEDAVGFSLNVSNFHATTANVTYGNQLSALVGGKHYVIDTSRNGAGKPVKEWCNTQNQAIGPHPTTNTGHPLADAFLWIKVPGQSDGPCNGGPRAGQWWSNYALELVKTAETLAGR